MNILHWTLCLGLSVVTIVALNKIPSTHHKTIESCLSAASIPVLTRGSSLWNQTIVIYNRRVHADPAVIVLAESIAQIQAAVVCGAKHKLRVTAKGRGHGFGAHGLGGENGHLLVALERMNRVNLVNKVAKIQPGARVGDIALQLFNQGKRAIAHGECPSVGIGGHVLHGGVGMATRTYGLTLDWLVGATVVLANGTIAHCSSTENKDLFWAIRGGGSSFGILAELEFNTFKAPKQVTTFIFESRLSQDLAFQRLKSLQELMVKAPKELNLSFTIVNSVSAIEGVFYGDQNSFHQVLGPFMEHENFRLASIETVEWIESLKRFSTTKTLEATKEEPETFYSTNVVTNSLSEDQLESFFSTLYPNKFTGVQKHSWIVFWQFIGGEHSVMSSIPLSDTAYGHRDKSAIIQFWSRSLLHKPYPAEGFTELTKFRESITNHSKDNEWGMYANYVDAEIDSKTAPKLYYGSNLERLERIKASLDPDDVFWNYQGVHPAA